MGTKLFKSPLKTLFSTLAVSVTLLSTSAQAVSMSQPSYTHVNGAYLNSSSMKRGVFLDLEYELEHKVFTFGRYKYANYNSFNNTRSESFLDLGAGKYFTIADGVTMEFSASLGRIADSGNLFGSGTAFYTLNTGFRNRFEVFETRLGYRYIKFDGLPSDSGVSASGWWYFSPQAAFGVTFEEVYTGSTWGIGARFSF